ncbi:hypothetical protein B0H63DRAFT_561485 [Podospora didyma]|uniref:Uncharacterized protein n=1 Tax=Podospora didyma TaxID=330526 RepID=A0AAE0NI02_9PEZI|nr:hypothetical protein B0H63DRAFT_561485 [Podospora didyma]
MIEGASTAVALEIAHSPADDAAQFSQNGTHPSEVPMTGQAQSPVGFKALAIPNTTLIEPPLAAYVEDVSDHGPEERLAQETADDTEKSAGPSWDPAVEAAESVEVMGKIEDSSAECENTSTELEDLVDRLDWENANKTLEAPLKPSPIQMQDTSTLTAPRLVDASAPNDSYSSAARKHQCDRLGGFKFRGPAPSDNVFGPAAVPEAVPTLNRAEWAQFKALRTQSDRFSPA